MAYDEELSQRFRDALGGMVAITEKRMMGGVCFMLNGNMVGGADRSKSGERRFMFRVGKDLQAEALERTGAMPVVLGKRSMGGMVFVDAEDCTDTQLTDWIALTLQFTSKLPAKS